MPREVTLDIGPVSLPGELAVPDGAVGCVLFAHGSGSSRHSPRNAAVARHLNGVGIGTLLFDLLTAGEAADRAKVFDIPLLATRLLGATDWVWAVPEFTSLPLAYFGASTGAGAALWAAADLGSAIAAAVSRGGRPDLAEPRLAEVVSPTLLIVGEDDPVVIELNRDAQRLLRCENRLEIVPGATHLFEEPGALERATELAADWFGRHLRAASPGDSSSRAEAQ